MDTILETNNEILFELIMNTRTNFKTLCASKILYAEIGTRLINIGNICLL